MRVSWDIKKAYEITPEFERILRFFVLECPLEGVNRRSKMVRIQDLDTKSAKRIIAQSTGLNDDTWEMLSADKVEASLDHHGVLAGFDPRFEFAIHNQSRNLRQHLALVYMIRCAFAHGAFSQRQAASQTYYALENLEGGKIKGRAVLKESTLLSLIGIFGR